jgi:hypothetical protein
MIQLYMLIASLLRAGQDVAGSDGFQDAHRICESPSMSGDPVALSEGISSTFELTRSKDHENKSHEAARIPPEVTMVISRDTGATIIYIPGVRLVYSRSELASEVLRVCRIAATYDFSVNRIRYNTSEQRKVSAIRKEMEEKRWRSRSARDLRDLNRWVTPSSDSLELAIAADWSRHECYFSLFQTKFGRVRDFKCRYRKLRYLCRIGVTATSARGPEYELTDLAFRWKFDADGSMRLQVIERPEPPEQDIVIID